MAQSLWLAKSVAPSITRVLAAVARMHFWSSYLQMANCCGPRLAVPVALTPIVQLR